MSAYGHQMEQIYSARSLSGGSEMRSSYATESGFYITSFAATILTSALAATGLLLITLLVSLAMMLQSCQSKNAGVVELRNMNYDYSYCKVYSLHAELNNMEGQNVPSICRDLAIHYIKGGQYARELELTESMIDDHFNNVRPSKDGLDVVLIDIDGIFSWSPPPSSNLFRRFLGDNASNCILEAKSLKRKLVSRLCKNLQAAGWPIILVSRIPETYRNATVDHLVSAGFSGWSSLMMRAEDEASTKENEWFSRQKNLIKKKGVHIKGIITTHMDALAVADTGNLRILLPDTMCDKLEQQSMSEEHR